MMQETNENSSMNVSSKNGGTSQTLVNYRGLFAPYQQQTHTINQILQNQMLIELHYQLRSLEQRAGLCIQVKNKAIEDEKMKSAQLQMKLNLALAEANFWKTVLAQKTELLEEKTELLEVKTELLEEKTELLERKTELCKNLAGKLLKVRRNELAMKRSLGVATDAEEAESSTGENNGNDIIDAAMTDRCKRRRF